MRSLFLIITLCFTYVSASAQSNGSIQGKIIDLELNNEPVLHANVQVNTTGVTTQTNFNGNFEINNLEPGSYVLTVNFAGYEPAEISVDVLADQTTHIRQGIMAKTIDLSLLLAQTAKESTDATSGSGQGLNEK